MKNSGVWPLGAAGAQAENVNDTSRHIMIAMAGFRFILASAL